MNCSIFYRVFFYQFCSVEDVKPPSLFRFSKFNGHRSKGLKCECLIDLGLLDEALSVLGEFEDGNSEKLKFEGILSFLKNDLKIAQKSLLKAAKLNSQDWKTFFYLGKLYIQS